MLRIISRLSFAITSEYQRLSFNRKAKTVNARRESDDIKSNKKLKKFDLAAVVMVRGENSYLKEWIEFHKIMGVSQFYIYDNDIEMDVWPVLAKYVESGLVTLIKWPDLPNLRERSGRYNQLSLQQLALGHCVKTFRREFNWLINCDVDEFIYPRLDKHKNVLAVLEELDSSKVTEVQIERLDFGSNGHKVKPRGLVVENYTKAASPKLGASKCIGNSRFLSNDEFFYAFRFQISLYNRIRFLLAGYPKQIHKKQAESILALNHYHVKSREEFLEKGRLNDKFGYMVGKKNPESFKRLDSVSNSVTNCEIHRFLPELKSRMAEPAAETPQPVSMV